MSQNSNIISIKGDRPVYAKNPSVENAIGPALKTKRIQMGTDTSGILVNQNTGESMGFGGALVYQLEEVDSSRFVKLYLEGIKQAVGLSKAGLTIFEIVYNQLQDNKENDRVELSVLATGLVKRTYYRGLGELMDKEFLYLSPIPGIYFVNIKFMFNGDRLAFVKGYYREGTPNPMKAFSKQSNSKDNQLSLL